MRNAHGGIVSLALALVALAVGCGGGSESSTTTVPPSPTSAVTSPSSSAPPTSIPSGSSSSTTPTLPTTTTATASTGGATPALPPSGAIRRTDGAYEDFTSPSANIGCVIVDEQARCDIRARDWTPPPAPADCELDYGQGIAMDVDGNAQLVCAGDSALSGAPPLAYGNSVQNGDMRCTSTEAEMVCFNVINGHGFAIARQNYRIF